MREIILAEHLTGALISNKLDFTRSGTSKLNIFHDFQKFDAWSWQASFVALKLLLLSSRMLFTSSDSDFTSSIFRFHAVHDIIVLVLIGLSPLLHLSLSYELELCNFGSLILGVNVGELSSKSQCIENFEPSIV